MARQDLERILREEGVTPRAYSLNGEMCEECHVIDDDEGQWLVFFVERGERREVRRFDSEDAAYREFLRRVLMDRTTRIPPPPPGTPPVQPRTDAFGA